MNKNKIIATILLATSLMTTTPALAATFKSGNYTGSGLEEVASGNQFSYFIINGKVIGSAKPVVRNGVTFVSAPDILDALGIEYTTAKTNGNILTVTVDGHEYIFMAKTGYNNYYTKDGEKIYIKIKEENGVKVPSNDSKIVSNGGKMYVPLSFFTKELGYSDAFSVDDTWCLNMGTGIAWDNTGATAKTESFTGEKYNKSKTVAEGWVCPILKSVSRDNIVDDAKTLINELEFDPNGNTSAIYSPQGTDGVSVGPFETNSEASHFSAIRIYDYNSNMFEASAKNNKIIPQVFKFYFPKSWQKVDEIYKAGGGASRYTIDGRDTVIDPNGVIFFSRVNGSLKGYLSDITSKGTIGTAYAVQTSNTGYWTKFGTAYWHYMDSNNNFIVGWKQLDGKWYYFDKDGRMVTNTIIDGYKIGSDGVWIQ